jgi:hypothetical protein
MLQPREVQNFPQVTVLPEVTMLPRAAEGLPLAAVLPEMTILPQAAEGLPLAAEVPSRTRRRPCGGSGWSWRQRARLRADAGRHRPPAPVRCPDPLSPHALRLLIANLELLEAIGSVACPI